MVDYLTGWLKKAFITRKTMPGSSDFRLFHGLLEAWVSIIGNILLFAIKFFIGTLTASISIVADSFHTLSDVVTSVVVLFGFKFGNKGPDREHPFGHGRIETISTMVIAILLVITGVEFIRSSYDRLRHPILVSGGWWVALILMLSAVFKEWMARFSFKLGKDIGSSALKADGWHHRSDAIASFLVAVGNLATVWGWNGVDTILGFGVSILIIYTGIDLARGAANSLIGTTPALGVSETITKLAKSIDGVKAVHGIQVHEYGSHREISLHVVVNERLKLLAAHEVAESVEKRVASSLQAEVVVHLDPRDAVED